MSDLNDQEYLRNDQYQDASNLNARIALHTRFSTSHINWFRWVFNQIEFTPKCRILELGCGSARFWVENRDRLPDDWEITLTDFSPGMLAEAKENLGENQRRFSFKEADAQAIPFEAQEFDIVIANHMLYHIPDMDAALLEIRRVLRENGRLCAATNGLSHMKEVHEMIQRIEPDAHKMRTAFRSFNLESGAELLSRWFASVSTHPFDNNLMVTEAGPLLGHVESMHYLDSDQLDQLQQHVADEIETEGSIFVTLSVGLFIAEKND